MSKEQSFITRHTTPERNKTENDPQSKQYPDLTEGGVEKAKERAKTEILDLIKNAPEGAVIFIGGSSDQTRTKATAEIYGKALAETVNSEGIGDDIRVLTREEIMDMSKGKGATSTIEDIEDILKNEDEKTKIVITFPMRLKGLSYGYNERWQTKEGKKTEYFSELLKKHGNDHTPAGIDWLENQGVLTTEDGRKIQGPNPTQVAKEYLESLERLKKFTSKYTDRPVIVGGVGHQWDLDATVTYLASGGKDVTIENFRQLVGDQEKPLIGEAEMFDFSISENKITVDYRGKQLTIDKND